jgi:predicted transglutaminase-like cysteine proteinase
MNTSIKAILGISFAVGLVVPALAGQASSTEHALTISTGAPTRAPVGWVEFCEENPSDCAAHPAGISEAPLTAKTWKVLVRINNVVNEQIRPMTDMEHYGVVEKWAYPDDGYGDCEDYVLLKRRMLSELGWPKQALLITVVRDTQGEGHAVLTVKTDKGEFVLDNQNPDVLPWSETAYRYVKRQSQFDPNVWVSLGDPRPAPATATSR